MKLKQMMFATLFSLAMVGQFLVLPVRANIPGKAEWQRYAQNNNLNLKPTTIEKIGSAFEKYHTTITGLRTTRVQRPNGKTMNVVDYQGRIKAAQKLQCKLSTFMNQLNKPPYKYGATVTYLIDRINDAKANETQFAQLEQQQQAILAGIQGTAPNAAFNEAQTVQNVMTLINNAEAEFRTLDQNPNNVGAFYGQHIRGITLALPPLKQNNPQTYAAMVDAFQATATQINTAMNSPNPDYPRLAAQVKGAIARLHAALDAR